MLTWLGQVKALRDAGIGQNVVIEELLRESLKHLNNSTSLNCIHDDSILSSMNFHIISIADLCIDVLVNAQVKPEYGQLEKLVDDYSMDLGGSIGIFASLNMWALPCHQGKIDSIPRVFFR